jgi:peptidyl-prolyl cis-trans isomerase B (cyclophilin B)
MKKLLGVVCALLLSTGAFAANPQVEIKTNLGAITVELYADKAPKTVENFLQYVRDGHYDNTIFHRVIDGFMIQGGGMEPGLKQKPTRATIANEAGNGLRNRKYTVAMARTSEPHSASSQFFINLADNEFLDYKGPSPQGWGYCVFGKVVRGQDVVDRIRGVATGNSGSHQNVPREDVVLTRAEEVAA